VPLRSLHDLKRLTAFTEALDTRRPSKGCDRYELAHSIKPSPNKLASRLLLAMESLEYTDEFGNRVFG
jgi:hypothetical protein